MVPVMKRYLVDKYLSEEEFFNMFSVSQITPGPIAVNMITYSGYSLCGFWGSVAATLGAVLPSMMIILSISLFFCDVVANIFVQKFFMGILAGVVAEILCFVIDFSGNLKFNSFNICIFVLSMIGLFLLRINPIYCILLGGTLGIIYDKSRRKDVSRVH
jgi:chromate transporter